MRCAAGVLAEAPQVVAVRDATLVQFGVSPDRLEDTMLLESAFASPGRYAGEIIRRLRRFYPDARGLLAVNPYLEVSPPLVEELVRRAAAQSDRSDFVVLTDDAGLPLGYVLSAQLADRIPAVHLGLLSCTDSALDARFLRASAAAGRRVSVGSLGRGLSAKPGNCNFWGLSPAIAEATRRAAEVLEALSDDAARSERVRAGDRAAVIGYHAGDVLFWIQALRLEQAPFRSLAVISAYRDIVSYLAPDLECLSVRQPIPHRPGTRVTDDLKLLWSYVTQLEEEGAAPRLWHLFRPFRDYGRTRHHLRESMAFALGGQGHARRPPAPFVPALQERARVRPRPGRVVVCFEGGWPLKEFPAEQRTELLSLLTESGYDPVVLGKPVPGSDVASVPYGGLSSYRVLLGSAEAMVGGDSFPAHFAQTLGVPTVQLFGSTRPANSSGVVSSRYRALHHPLPCVPCGEQFRCGLDGGHSCHAQANAGEVLAALREVVRREGPPEAAAETAPEVVFPMGTPVEIDVRERLLDRLYHRVGLDRVEACPVCGGVELLPMGSKFRLPVAECGGCGLWLATERIAERDLPVLYGESYWTEFMELHGYPCDVDRYFYDYQAAHERVRTLSAFLPEGGAVLEIGCGLGATLRRLAERGYRPIGLELDEALARKASIYSGVPVVSSFDAVTARIQALDGVIMFDVFAHLYDPVAYLRRLQPLMVPNGVVLLETFRTDCPAFQKAGIDHEDVKPIEHPYMYRQAHIEELLRRAGLHPFGLSYPLGEDHARVRLAARWGGASEAI